MFLLVFMVTCDFQTAKGVRSPLAEPKQITMQPVPKPVGMARTQDDDLLSLTAIFFR
jgi:hypothetical protein